MIGERFARVFRRDSFADNFFHTDGGHGITAAIRIQSTMEKELEFKDTLWGVNVLIRRHTAHGGFVHANVIGHIFKHQRFETRQSPIEKISLKAAQTDRHFEQRLAALFDAFHEPDGRAEFVFQILARVPLHAISTAQNPLIQRVNAQFGHAVVIEGDLVIIAYFHHHHIRHNIFNPVGIIAVTGLGVQLADQLDRRNGFFQ